MTVENVRVLIVSFPYFLFSSSKWLYLGEIYVKLNSGCGGVCLDNFSSNRMSQEDQFPFKTDFKWVTPLRQGVARGSLAKFG